jgi:RNA polymerase sigma-70 factor (ECF subfamily)
MMSFEKKLLDHMPALRAFAQSLTKNREDAEDLAQDTFVKATAARQRGLFQEDTNFSGWLHVIAKNTWTSRAKRDRRMVTESEFGSLENLQFAAGDPHRSLVCKETFALMQKLSPAHREALLAQIHCESYEEMAKEHNVAIGTMKSRVNRARAHLARLIEEEMGPTEPPI